MDLVEYYNRLKKFATNAFEDDLLKACLANLADETNKLRFSNFAYGIRELSTHVLESLSPDVEVKSCKWYDPVIKAPKQISRVQRIKYAIHGGIDDKYASKELVEVEDYITDVLSAIDILNKFTHVNEHTFGISESDVKELSSEVIDAFSNFVEGIGQCRIEILNALEEKIDDAFIEHAISENIDEVDILSTHHLVDQILPHTIKLKKIGSRFLEIEVSGYIDITQQFGSNSDLRNDIGFEMNSSFPFESLLFIELNEKFPASKVIIKKFDVDTDSWYE
jgi:hypothetical protein